MEASVAPTVEYSFGGVKALMIFPLKEIAAKVICATRKIISVNIKNSKYFLLLLTMLRMSK